MVEKCYFEEITAPERLFMFSFNLGGLNFELWLMLKPSFSKIAQNKQGTDVKGK